MCLTTFCVFFMERFFALPNQQPASQPAAVVLTGELDTDCHEVLRQARVDYLSDSFLDASRTDGRTDGQTCCD